MLSQQWQVLSDQQRVLLKQLLPTRDGQLRHVCLCWVPRRWPSLQRKWKLLLKQLHIERVPPPGLTLSPGRGTGSLQYVRGVCTCDAQGTPVRCHSGLLCLPQRQVRSRQPRRVEMRRKMAGVSVAATNGSPGRSPTTPELTRRTRCDEWSLPASDGSLVTSLERARL
jgi:hypothetical protein